jgi:hypothetical protein
MKAPGRKRDSVGRIPASLAPVGKNGDRPGTPKFGKPNSDIWVSKNAQESIG